ncbi:hypothetical protein F5883DRAFT_254602 [Diaporthe sp. PMI_573]|nr:hypothetical protein F5883DRAFT_254602 [Diaporthaceae sp. PMI_573]
MAQIKDNFQELHKPYSLFSGTDYSRSDFVSELVSIADQSRETLSDIEKAIASVSIVPKYSNLLRIVHRTQARIPKLRHSLRFQLALALINSDPDTLPSSGQLYVKHYSDQIRNIASSIISGKATFLRIVEEQWNALYGLRSDVLAPSPPSVPEPPNSTDSPEIEDSEPSLKSLKAVSMGHHKAQTVYLWACCYCGHAGMNAHTVPACVSCGVPRCVNCHMEAHKVRS